MNNRGIALLHIVMILIFIGAVIGIAALIAGPLSKRVKSNETIGTIDACIESLAGYASTNRRLPTAAQFTSVVQKANDAWGNPLYYIVDPNLAPASPSASTDYICGRKTTGITVRQCLTDNCAATPGTDYNDISNVAFVILSGGENFNVQTALAGTTVTVYVQNGATARDACTAAGNCPSYSGTMINRPERYDDTVKWVTLEELKNKAGCYGATQGTFRILNNELPGVCIGQPYNATLYSNGGVAPYSNWAWAPVLPAGLSMNPGTGAISGTPTGPAQVHSITFSRNDGDSNNAQKTLKLIVEDCPLGSWSFDDPANPGGTVTTGPGGSVTAVDGSSGRALLFSGIATLTPDNQGAGNSRFSFEYNQPFSIVMWVKLTKLPAAAPASLVYPLVSKGGTGPAYAGYYFEIHSSAFNQPPALGYNRIVFQLINQWNGGAGPMVWVYNTTPINTVNTWYHIAASYNGNGLASGVKVYVNGGSANAAYRDNLASSSIVNPQPLRVGDYGQNYYNSVVMDGIQVYNKVVRQLKVTRAGSGEGAVVSTLLFMSPERINCLAGGICEAYYATGTSVTLWASASPGSTFTGWSGGGCSGTGDCTVTLSSDTDVTATFTSP